MWTAQFSTSSWCPYQANSSFSLLVNYPEASSGARSRSPRSRRWLTRAGQSGSYCWSATRPAAITNAYCPLNNRATNPYFVQGWSLGARDREGKSRSTNACSKMPEYWCMSIAPRSQQVADESSLVPGACTSPPLGCFSSTTPWSGWCNCAPVLWNFAR